MGFFSWLTADTEESVMNQYTDECRPVYLLQPGGEPPIYEPAYEGYGNFGGMDANIWLARHNLPADKVAAMTEEQLRQYGILLDVGHLCVDQQTGKTWGCLMHCELITDQIDVLTFRHYDAKVIDGKTPNELLALERWVSKPFSELVGGIKNPLKFSFDEKADYASLQPSKSCPRQGFF